jgi:hypothetical protein
LPHLALLLRIRLRAAFALLLAALSPLAGNAQQGSTPLIYEVRSATNTVYLFGTIHVGTRGLYPLSAQVEEAFARSKTLALEADPTNQQAILSAITQGMYAPPDTLALHIPPDLLEQLKAVLPKVGLPFEYARAMKPYLLAMNLEIMEIQRLGYDPNLGMDFHFARLAHDQGKPIVELESMEGQMQLFQSMPEDAQEAMLRIAVEGIASGELDREMAGLLEAWAAGDAAAIHESVMHETQGLPEPIAKELNERIYDQRNREMVDRIAVMLKGNEPYFVAVGAGHMTGPTGLAELLRGKGFAVRRL